MALVISAGREVRRRKLQTVSANVIGCATALPLCYASMSMAARFVSGYKTFLVFVPLVFFSAAVSGWIVRRSYPRPMVVIYAGFCLVASAASFAMYAWLPIYDPIPLPVLAFFWRPTSSSGRWACWLEESGPVWCERCLGMPGVLMLHWAS